MKIEIGLQEILLGIDLFDLIFFACVCYILGFENILTFESAFFLFASIEIIVLISYACSALLIKKIEEKQ